MLRIFGGVLFLLMAAATVVAAIDLPNCSGKEFREQLAAVVFTGVVGVIGLLLALGFNRLKAPPHGSDNAGCMSDPWFFVGFIGALILSGLFVPPVVYRLMDARINDVPPYHTSIGIGVVIALAVGFALDFYKRRRS